MITAPVFNKPPRNNFVETVPVSIVSNITQNLAQIFPNIYPTEFINNVPLFSRIDFDSASIIIRLNFRGRLGRDRMEV
jgi:hypothetical protein